MRGSGGTPADRARHGVAANRRTKAPQPPECSKRSLAVCLSNDISRYDPVGPSRDGYVCPRPARTVSVIDVQDGKPAPQPEYTYTLCQLCVLCSGGSILCGKPSSLVYTHRVRPG